MTPEQEMRAVAIQAAASFCAPFSGVTDQEMPDGTIRRGIPNMEDLLFVADIFCGYIEGGWEEALRIDATSGKQEEVPKVRNVKLREQAPVEDILLPELDQQTAPAPPASSGAPRMRAAQEKIEASGTNVIPIEARGTVTKEQSSASRAVNRIRRQRAEQFINQAKVAKAEEHKARIRDEAEEAGLLSFSLEIEGRIQELGSYLESLWRR